MAQTNQTWNQDCVVTCSCGNTFTTGSYQKTIQVDICAACHPFFTGEMRFVDRQGRVDKFRKKMEAAKTRQQAAAQAQQSKTQQKQEDDQKSYQEILREKKSELRESSKQEKTDKK